MKQILQSLKTGKTEVVDVPCPFPRRGEVLIRSVYTLISAGTERALVEFGKAGWIEKSRRQPDKVRMVMDKVKTDGVMPAVEAVLHKLDQPLPLGYCNVGVAIDRGDDVAEISVGDRVVSNGRHAEVVSAPKNLCVRVPEGVSDEEASFTVIGAIGLQGIRLANPTLGETIVVTGLGLIGLTTVQLLRAQGCRVLGIDFDAGRIALARQFGAEVVNPSAGEDPLAAARMFSRGRGVDAVIITASTTSNEPVHQAALMCRKRGRIVLVGVTSLDLSRADFYEKELSFQVSCSYGPGRYDPNYEDKGQDYPLGFVRWTEQRNFEAVLDMIADGRLNVKPLVSHRFRIDEADRAYDVVAGSAPSLGILLQYPTVEQKPDRVLRQPTVRLFHPQERPDPDANAGQKVVMAFVGAGNYATAVLIPALKDVGVRFKVVATRSGLSGVHAGRKFGFEQATTDTESVFDDSQINAVVICTRHDSHASLVCRALSAGKHVFVEKPLALTLDELIEIERVYRESAQTLPAGSAGSGGPMLMVGFNRRFAAQVRQIRSLIQTVTGPKSFVMTVNAGPVPADHWTQDPDTGGGRILGEACHFIDLLRFLAGAPITSYHCLPMKGTPADTATIHLEFADGSIGTVHYFANGSRSFPKERLEVFAEGRVLQLTNFRRLVGYGWPGFSKMNLWRQDKGQKACARAFAEAVKSDGMSPIAFEELLEVGRIALELERAASS